MPVTRINYSDQPAADSPLLDLTPTQTRASSSEYSFDHSKSQFMPEPSLHPQDSIFDFFNNDPAINDYSFYIPPSLENTASADSEWNFQPADLDTKPANASSCSARSPDLAEQIRAHTRALSNSTAPSLTTDNSPQTQALASPRISNNTLQFSSPSSYLRTSSLTPSRGCLMDRSYSRRLSNPNSTVVSSKSTMAPAAVTPALPDNNSASLTSQTTQSSSSNGQDGTPVPRTSNGDEFDEKPEQSFRKLYPHLRRQQCTHTYP